MRNFETLLFDLDGTLTDPAGGFTRSMAAALDAVGLPAVPRDRLEPCIGPPLENSFRELGAGPDQITVLVEAYRYRYREVGIHGNQLYPGIPDALESLRTQGHVLHLATSKPRVFAETILERFGLDRFFSRIFASN